MPKETHYPATSPSQQRLAVQLADMIPGAVVISVSLADPRRQWPHPYTVAIDADGEQLPLSRTTTKVAARWVLRTWPNADWTRPHTLDLRTGQLNVGTASAVRGR
ncbi:transcriptional regulator [Streptomyces sp. SP17BM10]|uniref:transcriptional regulator n=1 Tax=Streptomyces sp. SP17BM10 TaxID=3002530 RepID=UPI002E75B38B|nr:transcriptional regulator [Streptomyces sp. SP17BM10]MEE1786943.1 transcriptional regulator [Streptomyces sp. SP17BM10]